MSQRATLPASPNRDYEAQLNGFDGILVPGGFGKRGIEGMLNAIRLCARVQHAPTSASASACRRRASSTRATSAGLAGANSGEFDPRPRRIGIIYKLRELTGVEEMGGTMRLGAWACKLEPDSLAAAAYGDYRDLRTPPPSLRVSTVSTSPS